MTNIRARQWIYVQYFDYLPIEVNDISQILSKDNCKEWAYIVHDKDHQDNGNLIKPHIHVLIKYDNPKTVDHLAKIFLDKPQFFEVWNGRINNGYSYLIHATSEASTVGKYKYSVDDVVASFDFSKRMREIQKQVTKKKVLKSKVVDIFINQYADDEIDYTELEDAIGVAQLAKRKTVIDHIDQINATKKHKQWLQEFKDKAMETHWLWGGAGVGKTRYARWIAKDEDAAILGSSRDYFQEYRGQRIVILNDLRPNDFNYADLLRILDPHEHNKLAPRRYHDMYLNLEMLIITTPYSPFEFYKESKIENPKVDTYEQLKRRVHSIHITSEYIRQVMPNEINQPYEWCNF